MIHNVLVVSTYIWYDPGRLRKHTGISVSFTGRKDEFFQKLQEKNVEECVSGYRHVACCMKYDDFKKRWILIFFSIFRFIFIFFGIWFEIPGFAIHKVQFDSIDCLYAGYASRSPKCIDKLFLSVSQVTNFSYSTVSPSPSPSPSHISSSSNFDSCDVAMGEQMVFAQQLQQCLQ